MNSNSLRARVSLATIAAATAFLLDLNGNAQNLLINGSFELPGSLPDHSVILLTNGDTRLTGWEIGAPQGFVQLNNGTVGTLDFPAVDGTYQVTFNEGNLGSGNWIAQTFNTEPGKEYLVSFSAGRLGPGAGNIGIIAYAYAGDGKCVGYAVAQPSTHGYADAQHLLFRATTPRTTLQIQDCSVATISVDVALDAVSTFEFASNTPITKVVAYVDGLSQFVIRPDGLWWNHLQYRRPGKEPGINNPTRVNGYDWYPMWPDDNDLNPAVSEALKVSVQFTAGNIQAASTIARGPVTVVQQPTAENGSTLIVQFDDVDRDGAAFYEITLTGVSLSVLPILSIQVASVALSFPAQTNQLYQVQYACGLPVTNWFDLGSPVQGWGTNALVLDFILGQPNRLYRVVPLQ